MRQKKLFAGRRVRDIRTEAALTQAAFATRLGISTSYLNQIENNQRHLTATVLIALAENFGIDIASLSQDDGSRLLADLTEAFADPLVAARSPSMADLQMIINNTPDVAHALLAMHRGLRRTSEQLAELDSTLETSGAAVEPTPYEEVRDFFHYIDNYVPELDEAAERLADSLHGPRNRLRLLADHIERSHRVRVMITERGDAGHTTLRRYDAASRVLTLSAELAAATNAFQIAHQIALIEHRALMDQLIDRAAFRNSDAGPVCRIALANYFAGAVMLPYSRFREAAATLRHDLHLLADRFEASVEQVAHRLSTLQRPGEKGVPFFFARVDQAGNITKRHSATKLQFARFGSTCPLWNVHRAFETPGRLVRQLAETPDGARYLCLALSIEKRTGGFRDPVQRHALALGCEISHAKDLVYADDLDTETATAFEPIGVSCRICERQNCHQRAIPPLKRALAVNHDARTLVPYSFR